MANIPSKNPANEGTLTGMLNTVIHKVRQATDGQLPAKIISYNRINNTAVVMPLIDMIGMDGKIVQRSQIVGIPVLALGGGGFCMTFPLVPGDTGWIEASDRDISLFLQSMTEAKPSSFRMQDFGDARFIPDSFRKYSFDNANDGASMVIQSLDGSVKLTLAPSKIKIVATTVEIDATTTNINSNLNIVGNTVFTGTVKANGHSIDDTHQHINSGGSGLGGIPQ